MRPNRRIISTHGATNKDNRATRGPGWEPRCRRRSCPSESSPRQVTALDVAEIHLHQVGRNQKEFIEAFGSEPLPILR